MASLKEMRNRIGSVKATQKITKAMQMVAAAKLKRATEQAENARPYAARMSAVIANLARGVSGDGAPKLLAGTGHENKHLIVVATADKGLAGGTPGAPATYIGMCHVFCDSVESFQAGFGPHAAQIMGDIPNYTDLSPIVQISEVVVG